MQLPNPLTLVINISTNLSYLLTCQHFTAGQLNNSMLVFTADLAMECHCFSSFNETCSRRDCWAFWVRVSLITSCPLAIYKSAGRGCHCSASASILSMCYCMCATHNWEIYKAASSSQQLTTGKLQFASMISNITHRGGFMLSFFCTV